MSSTDAFFSDNPWSEIKEPCYPYGRRLYLEDERFWVSMDSDQYLLFFVHDTGGDAVESLENIASLEVSLEPYGAGEFRLVCRLTSKETELEDKFATVAKDIAFSCSQYNGATLFLKTQERIKSWANFLRPSRGGLSRSEYVGLIGELYVLSHQLQPAIGFESAVQSWIGPEGKKQDFAQDLWALEVKTSYAGDPLTVRISSLDQLEKVTDRLFLIRILANPSTTGEGMSLSELYQLSILSSQHDLALESLFLQKVSDLYGRATDKQLEERFKVVNVSLFEVEDDFPRLTRTMVSEAVSNVRYDISMGALSSFVVEESLEELLSNE